MSKYKGVTIQFPVFKQVLQTRPELYTREKPHPRVSFDEKVRFCLSDSQSISLDYLLALVDGYLAEDDK